MFGSAEVLAVFCFCSFVAMFASAEARVEGLEAGEGLQGRSGLLRSEEQLCKNEILRCLMRTFEECNDESVFLVNT